jgi:PAS domain S-box-containing protein
VDQAAEAVVITDREGTIQYVNPAFERITGFSTTRSSGRTPGSSRAVSTMPSSTGRCGRRLVEHGIWSGHLVNRRKDGSLVEQEATISAVFGRTERSSTTSA